MHGPVAEEQACCFQPLMSGGFLAGAEDIDMALDLFWTLEGESSDGGRLDSKCGGSNF
jgi:hypothetical protein